MSRFRDFLGSTLGFEKAKLPFYRDLALAAVGGFSLIYSLVFFDAWRTARDAFDLKVAIGAVVLACVCVLLSPNKRLLAALELGLVVTLGTIGSILNRRADAAPIILVCALLMVVLIRFPQQKRNPTSQQGGGER
jgi:hypothetical protein